ncbi:lipid-A-disaccharide synthase [bacterium]|nr:lipid-A-disaccharide synthase [bacterium]
MEAPDIFVSAPDPSGEMHAARMLERLKELAPGLTLRGIGGPAMQGCGVELLCTQDRLAVMGLVEVLAHLPFFLRLMADIRASWRRRRPSLVILVDFPDFNLRLAAEARKLGIPVLYYISPQVWAWRQGRKNRIAELTDRLAAVFPFEVDFYRGTGAHVEYVGHPLLETLAPQPDTTAFRARWGLDPSRPLVGLLPGSRAQELERHLPAFLDAAARLRQARPELQLAVGLLPHIAARLSKEEHAVMRSLDLREVTADSAALICASRLLLSKSGTVSLEAVLHGTPLIIGYRTSFLSYTLARRLVKVSHIGMPNLLDPDPQIPELVQDQLTGERLCALALELLEESSPRRAAILAQCARVREHLRTGKPASLRVAEIALEMCNRPAEGA